MYGRTLRGLPLGCNSVLQETCEPQRARDTQEVEDKKQRDGTGQDRTGQTHYQPGKSTLRPYRLLLRLSQRWKTVGDSFIRADGQKKKKKGDDDEVVKFY